MTDHCLNTLCYSIITKNYISMIIIIYTYIYIYINMTL